MSFIEDFRKSAADAGVVIAGTITPDSNIHRFSTGDKGDRDGYYLLYPDGPPHCGIFGCWRRGIESKWKSDGQNGKVDPEVQKHWREASAKREKDKRELQERTAIKAREEIEKETQATQENSYLKRKNVGVFGPIRENFIGDLILPLQDAEGVIWSYQTIDSEGDKLFMPCGRVQGCFYSLCLKDTGPVVICEGYATGATIHTATGWSVVCAMNCGNLCDVAKSLRAKWPNRVFVIGADNDRNTPDNPGLTKATAAAKAIKCSLAIPVFKNCAGSDFNDLAEQDGIEVVRRCFDSVISAGLGSRISIDDLLGFNPEDDKNSVLGRRYLCKGGSCVIVGSTSAGKSSFGFQAAILWNIGCPFFGITAVKPLKSLFIQAENDTGDMAEMFQGILKGTGLVRDGSEYHDANMEIIQTLRENLIIKRDQTHSGKNFSPFVRSLIEIHQPDLVWIDPFLSFYGDDINDQQGMTQFLRADLNPISEQTGIIWMLLHHTGKPHKDSKNTQKSWTSRDFAYMGIGSSELSNWARAIITMTNVGEDEFRVVFAKRGWRAGVLDDSGNPTTDLYLAHSSEGICWKRIPKPIPDSKMDDPCSAFAVTCSKPLKASEIVRKATAMLKRGQRTVWSLWDAGDGPLGKLFQKTSEGLWIPRKSSQNLPYKDD